MQSWPSQTSVVPRLTSLATSITFTVLGTITGRKLRLCGAMGVRQKPLTGGLRIGPPALTLYAVEPLGVLTIIPSPCTFTPKSPSVPSESSTM